MTDRDRAARRVVSVIRSRLALISPERAEAVELARQHDLTAEDLILAARAMTLESM